MKRVCGLLVLALIAVVASAAPRSRSQAEAIAKQMAERIGLAVGSATDPSLVGSAKAKTTTTGAESVEAYYVFSNGEDKGFIIVSGEDKLPAIVGYTDNGTFDTDNMPVQLKEFLSSYVALVDSVQSGKMTLADNVSGGENGGSSTSTTAVEPLLGKIMWDQGEPYNQQTPLIENEHTVTGCGPTAVAQVMRYWKYPAALPNNIPAYTYTLDYVAGTITVDGIQKSSVEEENAYDWENMLEQYTASPTQNQKDAVAKLMNHVGHVMMVEYGLSAKGGTFSTYSALTSAFSFYGYDSSLLQELRKYNFSYSEWKSMITNEINHNRPVVYGGQSAAAGHAFVLDGIDANGLYHVNWGWSGSCNGYYDVTILNPNDNSGIGASSSTDGYAGYAMMVVGITKKNESGENPYASSGTKPSEGYSALSVSMSAYGDDGKTLYHNTHYNFYNKVNVTLTNSGDTEVNPRTTISLKHSGTDVSKFYISVPANGSTTYTIDCPIDSTFTDNTYSLEISGISGSTHEFTVTDIDSPVLTLKSITSNASEVNQTPVAFDVLEGTPTVMLPTLSGNDITYTATINNSGAFYRGKNIFVGYLDHADNLFWGSYLLEELPTGDTTLSFVNNNQEVGNFTGILLSTKNGAGVYFNTPAQPMQTLYVPNSTKSYSFNKCYCAYIAGPETNVSVTSANLASNDNAYYSSLYLDYAVQLPEGVDAYTAIVDKENSTVTLNKIESGIVPANTGVVLRITTKGNYELTPVETQESVASDLQGKLKDTPVTELSSGSTPYVLSIYEGSPAFQKYTGSTLRANKAYLLLTTSSNAKYGFRFNGGLTDISNVKSSAADSFNGCEAYNLQGQHVSKDAKGIIIFNGKKIINK